jgi:hypothetical protein
MAIAANFRIAGSGANAKQQIEEEFPMAGTQGSGDSGDFQLWRKVRRKPHSRR